MANTSDEETWVIDTDSINLTTKNLRVIKSAIEEFSSDVHDYLHESTHTNSVKCMMSYRKILKEIPSVILDNLYLFMDSELSARLNHLYNLVSDGLMISETELCFVEGFAVGAAKRLSNNVDMYLHTSAIAFDYTSDSTLLDSKYEKLNVTCPGWVKKKVLVYDTYVVPSFSANDLWISLIKDKVGSDHKVAMEFLSITNEDRDLLSNYYDDIVELMTPVTELGKRPKVHSSKNPFWEICATSNKPDVVSNYLRNVQNAKIGAVIESYIERGFNTKLRNLIRAKPCIVSDTSDSSDKISKFINCLEFIEREKTWYEYDSETGFYPSSLKLNNLKKNMYMIDPDEPEAYVRKVSDNTYDIIFNLSTLLIDEHMKDLLTRNDVDPEIKMRSRDRHIAEANMKRVGIDIISAYEEAEEHSKDLSEYVSDASKGAVFSKIMENMEELSPFPKVKSFAEKSNSMIAKVYGTKLCKSIEHEYEIAKSVMASFKAPVGYNRYYLSKNGVLASKSLIQRNCSTSTFSTVFALTTSVSAGETSYSIYKSISFNKNTLEWAIKKPFIVHSMLTWAIENRMSDSVIKTNLKADLCFLIEIISVNRDSFAQIMDQTRYMYMSSMSYATNFEQIFKKFEPLMPASHTEIKYMIRMVKTAHALSELKKSGNNIWTKHNTGANFVMPQDSFATTSFSYFVSSMYLSRLYNKTKAFPEPSEAVCMEGIIEEIEIYKRNMNVVNETNTDLADYQTSVFCCLNNLGERYVGSPAAAAICSNKLRKAKSVKYELYKSSVSKFNTSKAAMSGLEVEPGSQATKSFVNLLEMAPIMIDSSSHNSYSLKTYYQAVSAVILDVATESLDYCSYIVKKDQVGHREIYVMNYAMRLGTYFIEEVARAFSSADNVNVQNSPNKDKILESIMFDAHKAAKIGLEKSFEVYDNADAKRWGPNQRMDVLSAVFSAICPYEDCDIAAIGIYGFYKMSKKKIKYPHSLINYARKGVISKSRGVVNKFVLKRAIDLLSPKPFVEEPMGMGQGIFQEFSSVLHSIKQELEMDVLRKKFGDNLTYVAALVTSDDSFKVMTFLVGDEFNQSNTNLFDILLSITERSGSLFSILRNKAKSGYNTYFGEFNSKFYYKRSPASPTAKFRTSKIEAGMGSDLFSDLAKALASGSEYFSNGGSYMGTYVVTCLNYTLALEQWRLTRKWMNNNIMKMSVSGYIKYIEPLSILFTNPVVYMAVMDYVEVSNTNITEMSQGVINTISNKLAASLDSSYENVYMSNSEISNSPATDAKPSEIMDEIALSFYSGMVGMSRTSRTRTRYRKSGLEEKFKNEEKVYSLTKRFENYQAIYTKIDSTSRLNMNSTEEVDFHARFSDTWISREKQRYRKVKGDFLSVVFEDLPDFFSFNELTNCLNSEHYPSKYLSMIENSNNSCEPESLQASLSKLLKIWISEAVSVHNSLMELEKEFSVLTKKDMPKVSIRSIEAMSARFIGMEFNQPYLAAKAMGVKSFQYICEITRDLSYYVELAKKSDSSIHIEDFQKRMMVFHSKLENFRSPSRKILIPVDSPDAGPASVTEHSIRDKFIEGAGFEDFRVGYSSFEEAITTDISVIKEERELIALATSICSDHLKIVARTGYSDFRSLVMTGNYMGDVKTTREIKEMNESSNIYRKINYKIAVGITTGDSLSFNYDEVNAISSGRFSVPSKAIVEGGWARVYTGTKLASDVNELGMHVLNYKSSENLYHHYFIMKRPRNESAVRKIVLSSKPKGVDLPVYTELYDGSRHSADIVHIVYPDQLSIMDVSLGPTSTVAILHNNYISIPTFPFAPDDTIFEIFDFDENEMKEGIKTAMGFLTEIAIDEMTEKPEERSADIREKFDTGTMDVKKVLKSMNLISDATVRLRIPDFTRNQMAFTPFAINKMSMESVGNRERIEMADDYTNQFDMNERESDEDEWDDMDMEYIEESLEKGYDSEIARAFQMEGYTEDDEFDLLFAEESGSILAVDTGPRVRYEMVQNMSYSNSTGMKKFLYAMKKAIKKCAMKHRAGCDTYHKYYKNTSSVFRTGSLIAMATKISSCRELKDSLVYVTGMVTAYI